jgi:hypothetical protein
MLKEAWVLRKSQQVRELESHYRRPIAEIVAEAYTNHQTAEAAAAALTRESGVEINANTFGWWLVRLPIRVRKVASVAAARDGAAVA